MHTEIGWVGMIIFLIAYALVANKKVDSAGIPYNAMQVLGATAIAYSLLPTGKQGWPTIVLELFFIAIGVLAIITYLRKRARTN